MELSKQVVNLELSKRLKELGVKNESLFWWCHTGYDHHDWDLSYGETYGRDYSPRFSAFTTSELLEMLPNDINDSEYIYVIQKYPHEYEIRAWHKFDTMILKTVFDKNLCNTLAKMLISLIENKIIEV